jgi:hypothetical protein
MTKLARTCVGRVLHSVMRLIRRKELVIRKTVEQRDLLHDLEY